MPPECGRVSSSTGETRACARDQVNRWGGGCWYMTSMGTQSKAQTRPNKVKRRRTFVFWLPYFDAARFSSSPLRKKSNNRWGAAGEILDSGCPPPPCAVGHALPRAHTHACVARASLEVASAETVVTEGDGALTLAASCRLSVSAEPEDGAGGTKAVSGVSARGCGREAGATYKPGVDDAYLPQAPPS